MLKLQQAKSDKSDRTGQDRTGQTGQDRTGQAATDGRRAETSVQYRQEYVGRVGVE